MHTKDVPALLIAAMLWTAVAPVRAASPVLEATYTASISNGWVQVERWRDPGTAFVQETFYNLCGSLNDIALIHNEHTGPSDGVVFIASCNDSTGITNLGGAAVVAVNHLGLGWNTPAVNQITAWLSAP
jgi:hypothetical protein